mmetsp:Transcript_64851/g.177845  ORF Transcript_64851/g.177845 Transcript_64851/m.177845 type:complete len:206 (+) Transcript_64851:465-1082(+)
MTACAAGDDTAADPPPACCTDATAAAGAEGRRAAWLQLSAAGYEACGRSAAAPPTGAATGGAAPVSPVSAGSWRAISARSSAPTSAAISPTSSARTSARSSASLLHGACCRIACSSVRSSRTSPASAVTVRFKLLASVRKSLFSARKPSSSLAWRATCDCTCSFSRKKRRINSLPNSCFRSSACSRADGESAAPSLQSYSDSAQR